MFWKSEFYCTQRDRIYQLTSDTHTVYRHVFTPGNQGPNAEGQGDDQSILEKPSTKRNQHNENPQVSLEFWNCLGPLLCEIMTVSTHTCYN